MSLKHANTNPNLWINIVSLVIAIIAVAVNDEWVKENPGVILLLGMLNFGLTGLLQYLRDANKPKPTVVSVAVTQKEDKQITETTNTVTKQEVDEQDLQKNLQKQPEIESTISLPIKEENK